MFRQAMVKDFTENSGNWKIAEVLKQLKAFADQHKKADLTQIVHQVAGIVKAGNGIDTDTLQKAALLDSINGNIYFTRMLIGMGASFDEKNVEYVRQYNKEAAALMEGTLGMKARL